MAPPIKKDIVHYHDIAKWVVWKSQDRPAASWPAGDSQPPSTPSSPLMRDSQPPGPSSSPLMSSPSSASLDQSTEGLKYPPPGSLSIADKTLYNRINYRLKNAAMPSVVQQRYEEMIKSLPSNVNQAEWEELVGHILGSKNGQVDRMTKYKNQKVIKHELSISNKKEGGGDLCFQAQGNPN